MLDLRFFMLMQQPNAKSPQSGGLFACCGYVDRYALTVSRLTNVAWRGAAVSGMRAFLPAGFGGWPVGGGNDITGRLVPWACLTTTGATTFAAAVLAVPVAALFRVAFTFGAGLSGLILFT